MRRATPLLAVVIALLWLAGCASDDSPTASVDEATTTTVSSLPRLTLEPVETASTTTTVEPTTTTTAPPPPPPKPCTAVAHFGDSTSMGMVSSSYLPDPAQRLDAQYTRVGAAPLFLEIDGARSIVETHHGSPNARDTALRVRDSGFTGCWVFALGTTDAANVGAGSNFDHAGRIERMMAIAGTDPVLWVTVKTLVPDGAWSNANMNVWNDALEVAARKYPNMRIYDWAAAVDPNWFETDGIHYTSQGYAARARLIADALTLLTT